MNYKTKSTITILALVAFMVGTGIFINNLEGTITGSVVVPTCECSEDADCDDSNSCTEDICLYPENCEAAICVNNQINDCITS
ncbi:MAG: hypothetical protein V3V78_04105 [Candidatus Woesearchaeota archaeon]